MPSACTWPPRSVFDDEIDPGMLEYEAASIMPIFCCRTRIIVTKLLAKVSGTRTADQDDRPGSRSDLAHGYRRISCGTYGSWAEQQPTNSAIVVYDTMWESTAKMARAMCEGLAAGGAPGAHVAWRISHRSDIATELLDAGALLVGSPTLNNQSLSDHRRYADLSERPSPAQPDRCGLRLLRVGRRSGRTGSRDA